MIYEQLTILLEKMNLEKAHFLKPFFLK